MTSTIVGILVDWAEITLSIPVIGVVLRANIAGVVVLVFVPLALVALAVVLKLILGAHVAHVVI